MDRVLADVARRRVDVLYAMLDRGGSCKLLESLCSSLQ